MGHLLVRYLPSLKRAKLIRVDPTISVDPYREVRNHLQIQIMILAQEVVWNNCLKIRKMRIDAIPLVHQGLTTSSKNQEIPVLTILFPISCKPQNLQEPSSKLIALQDQVQMCKTETFTSRRDIPYLVQMGGRGLHVFSGQCLKPSRVRREMVTIPMVVSKPAYI